ncbi:MAG TPA: 3-deoxy-7-phosphoheptulonate synthase [Verrucomicrobia bacterium]|nr:3-deoxy-7-phosphoheptulonate synthase [Verrucomicrobiota bacterium]
MLWATDDIRIEAIKPLIPPAILMEELPLDDTASELIALSRRHIGDCLQGRDQRLVCIVGPCSIHDPKAALDYAGRLKKEADRLIDDLLIVMRVYFEKPRTSVGWKGLINDPFIDGSFAINKGLRIARQLLVDVNAIGLPAGCEFLDTIMPQFLADLVSWGAIGARTTESQIHRELASGMSCPIGFKNATNGNVQVAIDAIDAARHPHHFLSVTKQGVAAIVSTKGNTDCHMILRGGSNGPNDDVDTVASTAKRLTAKGLPHRIMVDCSHGNSLKVHSNQPTVAARVAAQRKTTDNAIFGLMLESNLVAGSQDSRHGPGSLVYGQSITDACIGWEETVRVLEHLAIANKR